MPPKLVGCHVFSSSKDRSILAEIQKKTNLGCFVKTTPAVGGFFLMGSKRVSRIENLSSKKTINLTRLYITSTRPSFPKKTGVRSANLTVEEPISAALPETEIRSHFPTFLGGGEKKNTVTHGNLRPFKNTLQGKKTYPPKMAFWRWFSNSQGGIC